MKIVNSMINVVFVGMSNIVPKDDEMKTVLNGCRLIDSDSFKDDSK